MDLAGAVIGPGDARVRNHAARAVTPSGFMARARDSGRAFRQGKVNALKTYVNPVVNPIVGSVVVNPKKTPASSRTGPCV